MTYMKNKTLKTIWIIIISLVILGNIAFYLYEVIYLKKLYTQNLFIMLAIVCLLFGTLIKVINGTKRKGLDYYESALAEELRFAFNNKPLQRKKLLCACRLYFESNYEKAMKYLVQLLDEIENDSDAVPIYFFMALCFTDDGLFNAAVGVYYQLLDVDPNHDVAHSNLGNLLIKKGDYENALIHYNKSIELNPKSYYAYNNRASYYFRVNDYENAIVDAEKALELKNNGVEAATLLTIIYALRGDEENKKKYYHIAIISGKNPTDLNEAIQLYLSEQNKPL